MITTKKVILNTMVNAFILSKFSIVLVVNDYCGIPKEFIKLTKAI